MTTDDRTRAIAWFEKQSKCLARPGAAKMFGLAAEALNALDVENEPLTMEQLRNMDGEPVYIKYHTCSRWEIYQGFMHDHGLYGKTWMAYRTKPETKGV